MGHLQTPAPSIQVDTFPYLRGFLLIYKSSKTIRSSIITQVRIEAHSLLSATVSEPREGATLHYSCVNNTIQIHVNMSSAHAKGKQNHPYNTENEMQLST